jgi:hypothetical protein
MIEICRDHAANVKRWLAAALYVQVGLLLSQPRPCLPASG